MMRLGTIAIACLTASAALADTIVLRDGTSHNGTYVSGTERSIVFRDNRGVQREFDIRDIRTLEFNPAGRTAQNGAALSQEQGRILPSGTELVVRTNETIDSNTTSEGRVYSATIQQDVRDNSGNTVVPRGSEAELMIQRVDTGGRVGSAELALGLRSLQIGAQRYLVTTSTVERSGGEGIGRNPRTAKMVGGGALLGTLVGAIAGGGKGALIGAIAGAAAGGTAQVLTRGKEVRIPAETVLTFRLDEPVRLQPERR